VNTQRKYAGDRKDGAFYAPSFLSPETAAPTAKLPVQLDREIFTLSHGAKSEVETAETAASASFIGFCIFWRGGKTITKWGR